MSAWGWHHDAALARAQGREPPPPPAGHCAGCARPLPRGHRKWCGLACGRYHGSRSWELRNRAKRAQINRAYRARVKAKAGANVSPSQPGTQPNSGKK